VRARPWAHEEPGRPQLVVVTVDRQPPLRHLPGRGTWRIARTDLEAYIDWTFEETATWIEEHPFTDEEPVSGED
jgi:hypothetical protein